MRTKQEFEEMQKVYQTKITDLGAKLAESNESHYKNIVELTKMATEKDRKIEELKQQLEEKDAEIKSLTLAHFESETNKPVLATTEIINQDKIELLEKVESYIKDSTYIKEPDYTNVCEYIRTLIKEIKGE